MAYRIEINFDACESNGICMDLAPEVFEVRDDGFLYLLQEYPADDVLPKVEEVVPRCPTQAITLVED
ncbi:MAG: ferredoxin [Saprospiraceae bacterium]|nr:ferredoxin [Saprospiraceae bacterium]